ALRFAKKNGWVFRLLTEREIRTQSLLNTKFLRRFKNRNVEKEDMHRILHQLARSEKTTPADLLAQLSDDQWEQAQLLPTVWYLVANRRIDVDLHQPLSMRCVLGSKD
ncbi:TnsA endonuclease C-terminal domain-containing protein, partial [Thiolapillus sp.]